MVTLGLRINCLETTSKIINWFNTTYYVLVKTFSYIVTVRYTFLTIFAYLHIYYSPQNSRRIHLDLIQYILKSQHQERFHGMFFMRSTSSRSMLSRRALSLFERWALACILVQIFFLDSKETFFGINIIQMNSSNFLWNYL